MRFKHYNIAQIGLTAGAPGGMGMGRGMPGMAGGRGMMGGGMMGGGGNSEFTARRQAGAAPSTGPAGKWLVKDSANEIKLLFKLEGSKLSGTIENAQMPGVIGVCNGRIHPEGTMGAWKERSRHGMAEMADENGRNSREAVLRGGLRPLPLRQLED